MTVINVHSADQLTVAFDRAIAGLGVVAIFADIFIVALDTAVGTGSLRVSPALQRLSV